VVGGAFPWADLGTWDGLAGFLDAETDGNVRVTAATDREGTVLTRDTTDCVLATDGRLSTAGVEGLIVASYGEHTLVVDREHADRIDELRKRQG